MHSGRELCGTGAQLGDCPRQPGCLSRPLSAGRPPSAMRMRHLRRPFACTGNGRRKGDPATGKICLSHLNSALRNPKRRQQPPEMRPGTPDQKEKNNTALTYTRGCGRKRAWARRRRRMCTHQPASLLLPSSSLSLLRRHTQVRTPSRPRARTRTHTRTPGRTHVHARAHKDTDAPARAHTSFS